ncbi:hypothetical protein [Streptomyces laurentii]|uniref:RNA methyltransferase, trmH family, group 1 n=1 Tax=Streptomyces laurentii TaxID=39478 RepID=A0A169PF21_STRLU|nr:RNA methyltransferase, trmH family, group 1 [Streptomyces laurentii]
MTYYGDWEKQQAYEEGRRDERRRIKGAIDGDDGDGCCGLIVLAVIIYFIAKACSG